MARIVLVPPPSSHVHKEIQHQPTTVWAANSSQTFTFTVAPSSLTFHAGEISNSLDFYLGWYGIDKASRLNLSPALVHNFWDMGEVHALLESEEIEGTILVASSYFYTNGPQEFALYFSNLKAMHLVNDRMHTKKREYMIHLAFPITAQQFLEIKESVKTWADDNLSQFKIHFGHYQRDNSYRIEFHVRDLTEATITKLYWSNNLVPQQ